MSENQTAPTKTASERLETLENTLDRVIQHIQPMDLMAKDLLAMKEALKLLNNKVDSVVKALNDQQPLTPETINANMLANNEAELKDKVTALVKSGTLATADTTSKDSFLALSEADAQGTVINPRIQFLLSNLQNEELRSKLEGTKVGDTVATDDKGNTVTVLEIYNIVIPQAPAAETPAADASASASTDAPTDSAAASAPAASASDSAAASESAPSDNQAPAASAAAS
jgi:hypothetical protein